MTIGGLTWDSTGQRYYQTGIDAVILYPWDDNTGWYGTPIAWNGVTAINENPSGAESNKLYADNLEYLNLLSKEEFGCTIECYQTPKEFAQCDGMVCFGGSGSFGGMKIHGQARKPFGLAYRVLKGSDTVEAGGRIAGDSYGPGHVWHFVYGCKAAPSSQDHSTVNDSPEAQTFSYEITTTPITDESYLPSIAGKVYPTAHVWFDCSKLTYSENSGQYQQLISYIGDTSIAMKKPSELYSIVH